MTFANPEFQVLRQSVVGQEGIWVKMFDPPQASPPTPDLVAPTNPVPEVMLAAGFQDAVVLPHTVTRHMMSGFRLTAFDGKQLEFFVTSDDDNPTAGGGVWPGPTTRMPRGVVFHAEMQGAGPPPHTIHWHGIEPTPINDGVGHCSMEVGRYTYQFQPNHIGFYFYHCHRNTVQHFEFGLYGALIVDPPDAYFASCANDPRPPGTVVTLNATPIGAGRPEPGFPLGRRRTAANLANFPQFPGFNPNALDAPDPELNNPALPAWLKFQTDPHAMTVPYDVEALWVTDDRDSNWSDNAKNARQTFPAHGPHPGIDDVFDTDRATWAAFNQFNADYWFVTGVNFPGTRVNNPEGTPHLDARGIRGTGTGDIGAGIVAPAALVSGVAGVQVSINASTNQTILLRCLNGAYNDISLVMPVDMVIIAWDGRGLGVGPFGQYNRPVLVPAGTPTHMSVARRFDALIRTSQPVNSFANIQFIDTRGEIPGEPRNILFTGRIPIVIGAAAGTASVSGSVIDSRTGAALAGTTIVATGSAGRLTVTADASGNFSFGALGDGDYTIIPSRPGTRFSPREMRVTVAGASIPGLQFRGRSP